MALKYGADAGAVISQNSWGYTNVYEMPEITKDAIDYFIEYAGLDENGVQVGPMKGGIVIFAAGNEERDYRSYPACYERVLSVSALAPDYRKSYYSNFSEWIDVAAPGGSYKYEGRYGDEYAVYSTLPGNAYGYMQGTSMACPHVSGIAALAVAKYGGPGFTPDKLRSYLERGVHEVDSYNPDYEGRLGSGLVDAYLAVSMDRGIDPDPVADLRHSDTAGEVELTWSVPADGDDGRADSFILMWRVGTLENPDPDDLPEGAESVVIPVRDKQAGDEITYVLTDIAEQTRYTVAIVAVDPWGNRSETTVISFGTPANTPPALILESTEEVRVGYNRHRNGAVPCFGSRQPRFHLRVAGSFRRRCDPQGGRPPLSRHLQLQTHPGELYGACFGKRQFRRFRYGRFRFHAAARPAAGGHRRIPAGLSRFDAGDGGVHAVAGFRRRGAGTVAYALEYDEEMLYLQPVASGYRIMPLRYGRSEVTVVATDEGGLAGRDTFAVMCRDDSREVDLYPNPVRDRLSIRMGRDVEGALRVALYDAAGRRAFAAEVRIAPTAPAVVDLSSLGGGTYTIELRYEGGSLTRSIVKL